MQLLAIAQAHPGQRLELWFHDEARFGQQGTLTRVWSRRGSRPRAVRQTRYDWVYVLGAVCPQSGQSVGLLSPYIDAGVMNIFLEQFQREVAGDVHVVMIWDQAGYHTAKDVRVPDNLTILRLPPYSPELNPVENLWHYLRSHYWANHPYENYDRLLQAACHAWRRACLDPDIIKSVCRVSYMERI